MEWRSRAVVQREVEITHLRNKRRIEPGESFTAVGLTPFPHFPLPGQAGKGTTEEFGLLSLEYDENFCMGGPGVIFSRETLRRGEFHIDKLINRITLHWFFPLSVAPHIPTCLKNLYSTHEDVEVGRCVQKFAGIPCTWNYEVCVYLMPLAMASKQQFFIICKHSHHPPPPPFPDAINTAPQCQR